MTATCPDCRSIFRVDPAKVPPSGVRARCSVCGGVMLLAGAPQPSLQPSPTPQPSHTPQFGAPRAVAPRVTAPSMAVPGVTTPSSATPSRATPAFATPALAPPRMPPPPTPVGAMAAASSAAPASAPSATPAAAPAAAPAALPRPVTGSVGRQEAASQSTTTATPRRPINPFLTADPGQRARRLARALVSDLVAYHPQKREEGLRDGTLRPLFRDEIKKSYEEYVEQVGRELAESTPHFQDALNDILAGGQRLF